MSNNEKILYYRNLSKTELRDILSNKETLPNDDIIIASFELGSKEIYSLLDFNSIKVRLELDIRNGRVAASEFQFHKGTIRTLLLLFYSFLRSNFNSIKVRLEPFKNKKPTTLKSRFQFHKGTIRT